MNEAWPASSLDGTQLLVRHVIFPTGGDTKDGSGSIALLPSDRSAPARETGKRTADIQHPDPWKARADDRPDWQRKAR